MKTISTYTKAMLIFLKALNNSVFL